ncbi:hypothetical protein AB3S75_003209 [Citrus x aurantiifolia]
MTQKANAHRRELQFNIGDRVLVHLQLYRQTSLAQRASQKLAKRYYGPFTMVERVGPVAYKLDLPFDYKINLVFHISILKPLGAPVSSTSCLCPVRASTIDPFHTLQLYVPHGSLTSWEKSSTGSCTVPDFHLEDKVIFRGPRNDTIMLISLESLNLYLVEPIEERAISHQEEDTTKVNTQPVARPS